MHFALLSIATVLLAGVLGGCTIGVSTDPNRFSIEPQATAHLRAPQNVALLNGYASESTAQFNLAGNTLEVERKELTQTAIAMLGRALQKQGYTVSSQAQKSIALRVIPTGVTSQAFRYTGRLRLEARFGDGSEASIPQDNLGATWERAFDGAVLFALTELLAHERFIAYMNK